MARPTPRNPRLWQPGALPLELSRRGRARRPAASGRHPRGPRRRWPPRSQGPNHPRRGEGAARAAGDRATRAGRPGHGDRATCAGPGRPERGPEPRPRTSRVSRRRPLEPSRSRSRFREPRSRTGTRGHEGAGGLTGRPRSPSPARQGGVEVVIRKGTRRSPPAGRGATPARQECRLSQGWSRTRPKRGRRDRVPLGPSRLAAHRSRRGGARARAPHQRLRATVEPCRSIPRAHDRGPSRPRRRPRPRARPSRLPVRRSGSRRSARDPSNGLAIPTAPV